MPHLFFVSYSRINAKYPSDDEEQNHCGGHRSDRRIPCWIRPAVHPANRLKNELRQSREGIAGAELRDLIGQAYVHANQKNYGLAAETSSLYFNRAREVANQTQDANRRKALEHLLALRDRVTAELAKGDAAVMGDLQELFIKTRQATRSSSER